MKQWIKDWSAPGIAVIVLGFALNAWAQTQENKTEIEHLKDDVAEVKELTKENKQLSLDIYNHLLNED